MVYSSLQEESPCNLVPSMIFDGQLQINLTRPTSTAESFKMSTEKTEYKVEAARSETQQMMAGEFDVTVKDWWVEGGRLVIPKEFRGYMPKPGEPIVLIDYEGRMYRSKMHNLWQGVNVGRIDGIKPFYKNHPIVAKGTKLHVKVTGSNTAVVILAENPAR